MKKKIPVESIGQLLIMRPVLDWRKLIFPLPVGISDSSVVKFYPSGLILSFKKCNKVNKNK